MTDQNPSGGAPFKDQNDASAGLFDLRHLIGVLFVGYGVVLVVASFLIGTQTSDGIDINLSLGLGMAALGAFFLAWAWRRPLHVEGESVSARRDRGR